MLETTRTNLNKRLQEYNHARLQAKAERQALADAIERIEHVEQAQTILQQIAQAVQQTAHKRIAQIVTKCLQTIFGEDAYEFRIDFERKRGKTEANLTFIRDGLVLTNPIKEVGLGVVDVCSMALRLACMMLAQPQRRKLIVADEPYRMVSAQYRPAIKQMLDVLAEELEVQFIIVTHADELKDENSVEIGL